MYKGKSFLAIIPARYGSKSIVNKNLQKIGKKTLLGRSIDHAKQSRYIDHIVVSTNGKDIKEEALFYRAAVVDRPEEISGPLDSTESALIHAVENINKEFDYVVLLQPTSPFRLDGMIDRCIRKMVDEDGDSLLTVWKFHNFCFYYEEKNGELKSTFDYLNRPMRQKLNLKEWFNFDNGNVYIIKTKCLLDSKCRISGKVLLEPITAFETIQIDEQEDLEVCRKIIKGDF